MALAIGLAQASAVVDGTLGHGARLGLAPLTVAVLDPGGHLVALKRSDGSGILRAEIAMAKAWGVLAMGWPARELLQRAQRQPQFFSALGVLAGGRMLPAAGGVPIRDQAGTLLGAVGVSGDTSDNDEACAVAAIRAAGLVPWLGNGPGAGAPGAEPPGAEPPAAEPPAAEPPAAEPPAAEPPPDPGARPAG